jgi:hypothetical protein
VREVERLAAWASNSVSARGHAPRKNIFEIMRSRLTGFARLPAPAGTSDQSSLTFSSTLRVTLRREGKGRGVRRIIVSSLLRDARRAAHMLQCLSNARTRPSSLWLFRKLMSTCVLFLTLRMRIENGPFASWSCSVSSFGFAAAVDALTRGGRRGRGE